MFRIFILIGIDSFISQEEEMIVKRTVFIYAQFIQRTFTELTVGLALSLH